MKRFSAIAILALSFMLLGSAAWAAETKEEKALKKDAVEIDKTAGTGKGAAVVTERIEKEFGVTASQVNALRDQKLGYGEISIVYSLTSKMPGGITDANVAQIMTLRQGPPVMGWGEISNKLGFKLGSAVSEVKNIAKDTDKEMKSVKETGSMTGSERSMERHGEMGSSGSHGGMGAGGSHGSSRGMGY